MLAGMMSSKRPWMSMIGIELTGGLHHPWITPGAARTAPASLSANVIAVISPIMAPTDIPVTYKRRVSVQKFEFTSFMSDSKNRVSLAHDAETHDPHVSFPEMALQDE